MQRRRHDCMQTTSRRFAKLSLRISFVKSRFGLFDVQTTGSTHKIFRAGWIWCAMFGAEGRGGVRGLNRARRKKVFALNVCRCAMPTPPRHASQSPFVSALPARLHLLSVNGPATAALPCLLFPARAGTQ